MKESKLMAVMTALLTALAVLSGSIAVPILCRPFYYAHIRAMGLSAATGLTEDQIRQAYDQMMDFCLGLRPDFAAGILPWSASGRDHFADVAVLFQLDLWVLALSLLGLVALFVLGRVRKVRPALAAGHGPGFWGAVGLGATFLVIGGLAATDFDRAFVIFHTLFFPGKTNWIFDWQTDPIILLLPQDCFRNCALLILALLEVWCAVLILADLLALRLRKRRQAPPPPAGCSGCPGCGG